METRHCPRCKQDVPLDQWQKNAGRRSGYQGYCRLCLLAYNKARYEQVNGRQIKLDRVRFKQHGITAAEVDAIEAAQGGVCAICGGLRERALHLDHDHATGKVRGLLCGPCNQGLGLFQDDPDLLRQAAAYVDGHRAR